MGALGQILVTGAAGFIGRAVVAEARACGLSVIAVTRRRRAPEWDGDDGVTVLNADLGDADAIRRLRGALEGCEAVVHAAASLSGDPRAHFRDTLTPTQMLVTAMRDTGVQRLVLLGSLAVYDMSALPDGAPLDETCPIETPETARDAYVQAKLRQEQICREAAGAQGFDLWVLRPGAVYGPDRLWNGHLGIGIGPVLLRIGGAARVPVCHVETVARAVVLAAQNDSGGLPEVNLLDRHLPTRSGYVDAMRPMGWPQYVLPVPYSVLRALALASAPLGSKRPGLLRPRVLRARMGAFDYDTTRQAQRFGAPPDIPFETLIEQALAAS